MTQAQPKPISNDRYRPSGVIALVPARGGSKGVPRKNVLDLCGKPVIAWSIDAALNCQYIDRVFVSTEDNEIAEIAVQYGATVLDRPFLLAADEVQLAEVVVYSLRQLNHELNLWPETLCILQADSPLKRTGDINTAIELYNEDRFEGTVFSAFRDDKYHWRMSRLNGNKPVRHNPAKRLGRQWEQSKNTLWQENGSIYIAPASRISLELTFRLEPYTISEMAVEDSIQIDTERDLELCRLRLEERMRS